MTCTTCEEIRRKQHAKHPPRGTVIHCDRCKKPMMRKSSRHKYCEDCRKIIDREQKRGFSFQLDLEFPEPTTAWKPEREYAESGLRLLAAAVVARAYDDMIGRYDIVAHEPVPAHVKDEARLWINTTGREWVAVIAPDIDMRGVVENE